MCQVPLSCENEPAQALYCFLSNLKRHGSTDKEHEEGAEEKEWPVAILDRLYEWIGNNTLRLIILSIENTSINNNNKNNDEDDEEDVDEVAVTRYGVEVLHDYGERMKADSLMSVVVYLYNVSSVSLRDMLVYAKCAQYIGGTIDDEDEHNESKFVLKICARFVTRLYICLFIASRLVTAFHIDEPAQYGRTSDCQCSAFCQPTLLLHATCKLYLNRLYFDKKIN